MGAKGKINASKVQAGDRIIVGPSIIDGRTCISSTKTGEGVHVARVIRKDFRSAQGPYERQGRYVVETTSGTFTAAPVETMWLAPEDAAGIKRAMVEAQAEDEARSYTAEERADEDRWTLGTIDDMWDAAEAEDIAREVAKTLTAAAEAEAEADPRQWATEGTEYPYRGDANRHVSQTGGDEELTLHSQDGKVDNMNNASDTDRLSMTITETGAAKIAAHLAKTAQADTEPVTSTEDHTGSAVVTLLEKVWTRIRADHPELPEVVIITGSGLVGASKWGHFRAEGWKVKEEGAAIRKHELFLAGEALAKGAAQTLQTMLHEAAHTLAKVRGEQDTSRQGRWHNATFRKTAEEMGLEHRGTQADKSHGFSFVTLTEATKERYADLLTELDAEIRLVCHLPLWLGGTADEGEDKGGEKITGKPTKTGGETKSGPLKATCECDEPLIIRLSQKVLDLGVVRCDECESLFTAA